MGMIGASRTYLFKSNAILSLNDHYFCARRGRPVLSGYARKYKESIAETLRRTDEEFYGGEKLISSPQPIIEDITFLLTPKQMLFANGGLRRRDISNFIKLAEDGVFAYLGIGDEWVVQLNGRKLVCDYNAILFTLTLTDIDVRVTPDNIQNDIQKYSDFIDKNNLSCILPD